MMVEPEPLQTATFRCCDTEWTIGTTGLQAGSRVQAAQSEALRLESILNAFDPQSAVSDLNRAGHVTNPVVAAVVERALDIRRRTRGVFDIAQGDLEKAIKSYIRGDAESVSPSRVDNLVTVDGDFVTAAGRVDLNGIAKGWIVDRVYETLRGDGDASVEAFVDGGGDIAHPIGPIAIDAPGGGTVAVLDTRWNVATSGNSRRRRGDVDHLYDPRTGRVGSIQQQVTVLSQLDCTEADALATVLCVLPPLEATALAESWIGVEALFVRNGQVWWTRGFESHIQ